MFVSRSDTALVKYRSDLKIPFKKFSGVFMAYHVTFNCQVLLHSRILPQWPQHIIAQNKLKIKMQKYPESNMSEFCCTISGYEPCVTQYWTRQQPTGCRLISCLRHLCSRGWRGGVGWLDDAAGREKRESQWETQRGQTDNKHVSLLEAALFADPTASRLLQTHQYK